MNIRSIIATVLAVTTTAAVAQTNLKTETDMETLNLTQEWDKTFPQRHGSEAHSRYFSEDAYKRLTGDNKELLIIPGANHCDLYDNLAVIPFDKIEEFYKKTFLIP